MISEPKENFDTEEVEFDADVGGRPLKIVVGRNLIDDKLERQTTTEERVQFVTRNKQIIAHNVGRDLVTMGDVTGIRITEAHLKGCYSK